MSTAPLVELRFNPTDLRPRDLPSAGAFLGSPADALEAALAVTRAAMVDQMRAEIRGIADPSHAQLMRIADLAWQAVFWRYRKISAPVIADAYRHAYQAANAGDVPDSVLYDLADKHAEKVGDYFHTTSREALSQGFNTLVNRRLPAKAAVDRILDGYGLTPRQMRGFVSAQQQFNTPISDVLPRSLKAKARAYVDKAFTTRTRKLSRQEEHNINQQAQQFAWMWLQDKGRLPEKAQKMWITASDERVCLICGPLHGQKVAVGEQFKTKEGDFWTPGLHPNCRCKVRLLENTFAKADWDPVQHPRGGSENSGRFRRVLDRDDRPVINVEEQDVIAQAPPMATISPSVLASLSTSGLAQISPTVLSQVTAPATITQASLPKASLPKATIQTPQASILGLALPRSAPVSAPVVSHVTVVREPKKKVAPYQEIRPLDEAYYKVVSGDVAFHQFDKETFSADRDQVILDAAMVRENAIEGIMDQHVVDEQVTYKEPLSSYGVPLEARIPAEEFRNILETLAQHTTSEPPNDALIEVDFYDPDGSSTDPPLETLGRTVLDIAHAVGVDQEHLTVHVAKLEAVHSENVGRGTAQRIKISGHPYDMYDITGDYSVDNYAPEYEDGTGTPNGIDIYTVEPHDPAIGFMEAPDLDES